MLEISALPARTSHSLQWHIYVLFGIPKPVHTPPNPNQTKPNQPSNLSGSVLLGSLGYKDPATGHECSDDDWSCWRPAQVNLLHTLANATSGCVVVLTGDYHYSDIKVRGRRGSRQRRCCIPMLPELPAQLCIFHGANGVIFSYCCQDGLSQLVSLSF